VEKFGEEREELVKELKKNNGFDRRSKSSIIIHSRNST